MPIVFFNKGEWITITSEGFFNKSLNGGKYLNVRFGNKVDGINQFYDVFYRPDIVEHKLKGHDISPLINLTIEDALKSPPPEVKINEIPTETKNQTLSVNYDIKSTGGGIGEVRVFHNGKLIKSDGYYKNVSNKQIQLAKLETNNGRSIYDDFRGLKVSYKTNSFITESKGDSFNDNIEIDLVPGENDISVCAFNKDNTIQSAMQTVSIKAIGKPRKPNLHVLAIGIDKYQDSSKNLKYAVKDANDFVNRLTAVSRNMYKEKIYTTLLTDNKANKQSIIDEINQFAAKVKITDVAVIFIASHGVLIGDQYYMVTHDYNGAMDETCMISSNDFIEFSKKIKALNQIFVLDTCHAGGMDYIVSGLYDARISVLAKKIGLHVFASSSSFESAMDGYKGNGLFTHNLLEGLNFNKNADKNNDKQVGVVELGKFTEETTEKIAKEIGHSQKPKIINFGRDMTIYDLN